MGLIRIIKCHNCGYVFDREYGVNINGHSVLHCDKCGKSINVDFSGGWVSLSDCDCGGHYDADALGSCPKCKAMIDIVDVQK